MCRDFCPPTVTLESYLLISQPRTSLFYAVINHLITQSQLRGSLNYSLTGLIIQRRQASHYSEATIRRPSEDDSIPQRATYWCVQTSSFSPRRSQLKSWQDNWVRQRSSWRRNKEVPRCTCLPQFIYAIAAIAQLRLLRK